MRFFILVIILLTGLLRVSAQKKEKSYFKLPSTVTSTDFIAGSVWVKVKPAKKGFFQTSAGRIKGLENINSKHPLMPEQLTQWAASSRGPRNPKSGIDISDYYQLTFPAGQNIEEVINKLYATGYFEIVEPEYIDRLFLNPNDPNISSQYYLDLINSFEAWDVTQGSDDVVIAIIDSGGDLDHPDLASKLYVNQAEFNGTAGVDDDGNGFIDDIQGWDFIGADTLNAYNPDFIGDNNPNITKGGAISHGTSVAGCAAAATNNGTGIAGVGFNTKIMFTKHSGDNQPENGTSVYSGYSGILYAAEVLYGQGKKAIINCSWGGTFSSQIAQDLITYVTLERNALVVAAAGNERSRNPIYPAGYDYVLSVAATDQQDKKASFSNSGQTVDISAPGVSIRTTSFNDSYTNIDGTSFSSPIAAGAAALVWAHNPSFNAIQVGEQLRVTADESFYAVNTAFEKGLGKGRLDVKNALTLELPSIRASNPILANNQGLPLEPGQPGKLIFNFINYLKSSSSGTQVTISSLSNKVTITKGTIQLGIIPEGVTISNNLNAFELSIATSTPLNTVADILLTYQDGAYTDYQFFSFLINPSFINIDENQITTTIAATGRLGFDDPDKQDRGIGFVFNENSTLYEMGLLMGSSSSTIKNNVRGINNAFDQDFFIQDNIKQILPGERSYSEIFGSFLDASTEPNANLKIKYRSLVWRDAPDDKYVILEYIIKNTSATPLENFYFGIFADWDISGNGQNDKGSYINQDRIRLGYVYPAQNPDLPMSGIQLLNYTNKSLHYAIDNDQTLGGPFGLYDGYTDSEKFTSLSTNRPESVGSVAGNDVSHVVSAGPFDIAPGEELTLAFALHAGFNLDDLISSAQEADTMYNFTLQATQPATQDVEVCYNNPATLMATGANSFKWYNEFTGGDLIFEGASFTTGNLTNDTAFFVANAENSFESVRTQALITVKANPEISASGFTTICDGQSLILSVATADEYLWSTTETTQSIEVNEDGVYSVFVRNLTPFCESTSQTVTVTVNPSPVAAFSANAGGISGTPIDFTDESTDAIDWFWQFGDGQTSIEQNPTHQYTTGGDYQITLTATAANGCQDIVTNPINIITSTEKELEAAVTVYPNPAKGNIMVEAKGLTSPYFNIQLINVQSQSIYIEQAEAMDGKMTHTISADSLPAGLYIVKISNEGRTVIRKVIKIE